MIYVCQFDTVYLISLFKSLFKSSHLLNSVQGQIETIRARTKLLQNFEICLKKKSWVEYEELYVKYTEQEEDFKRAKE